MLYHDCHALWSTRVLDTAARCEERFPFGEAIRGGGPRMTSANFRMELLQRAGLI